jgi:TrmH family RNA methyltransferase
MIPLQKLAELPRSQRLRKAAKIMAGAEQRFIISPELKASEAEYLGLLTRMLALDEGFSGAAAEELKKAQEVFVSAHENKEEEKIRRALNTICYLLLAETGRYQADWDFLGNDGVLDPSKRHPFPGMQVYLEDIRSPFNVGAMFRAAESFGAEKIWLSPLCADPRHKRAGRTAMGCVDILPWERLSVETKAGPFIGNLFALETGGVPLKDFIFPSRGVLIAGSEELGVSPGALAAADASLGRVSIPVFGAKGSLNVSVAFGIVMQAWASRLSER